MPPFVARKRRRSTSPPTLAAPKSTPAKRLQKKPTLFETLEQKAGDSSTVEDNKAFLDELNGDTDSSLSDISSSEFEDVLSPKPVKRRKVEEGNDDDEEADWEDAMAIEITAPLDSGIEPSGDLELTLDKDTTVAFPRDPHGMRKGPSKIERQIRVQTHCMHVQFLLFHNLLRNGWVCDTQVQKILLEQLTPGIKNEFSKWKTASGIVDEHDEKAKSNQQAKSKGKARSTKELKKHRNERDWGQPAEKLEEGVINMSRGDPLLRFLKLLASFWKKKFTITAPGLRKQGYKPLPVLESELASFKNDPHDVIEHGEKIPNIESFREHARTCEGSRDVGEQLFTALLRGLGLEARLVASLQPGGFGWNKGEDAVPKKTDNKKGLPRDSEPIIAAVSDPGKTSVAEMKKPADRKNAKKIVKPKSNNTINRQSRTGDGRDTPINLSRDSSELSSAITDNEADDESVVDVTPSTLKKKPSKPFDRDLTVPIYWTEVLSPISNSYIPIDPITISTIATNSDLLSSFEPRGASVDKPKQVLAYVVAFAADGTAKDVTVRYLKRHMWPGKTRAVRMPVEKIPIHNKRGKVKRYEEYDWFKSVMSGYARDAKKRTAADDLEEETDLKPMKVIKQAKQGEETLQGYKNSAEFILERHLRREEALLPGSTHVKIFTTGKGEKAMEEKVFRREDVMVCKTSESWHKEGREVVIGEQPMKMVPVRAVTLTRKREVEDALREGEKLKQGLYAIEQTEWIIPPPIQDGIIPKNAFGNMDCYVPTMVPKGAVHIPLRSTMKICKRLGIEYAEAVTGFEFGKQRAVPVITGVVVAEENEHAVLDAWEVDEEERRKKEEGKREKLVLTTWRKFLMGLRIVERVREEYKDEADAHMMDEMNPFTNKNKKQIQKSDHGQPRILEDQISEADDETLPGGFIAEGHSDAEGGGGFIVEDEDMMPTKPRRPLIHVGSPNSPVSLQSAHQKIRKDTPESSQNDDRAGGSDTNPSMKKTFIGSTKGRSSKETIKRKGVGSSTKSTSKGKDAASRRRTAARQTRKVTTAQKMQTPSSDEKDTSSKLSELESNSDSDKSSLKEETVPEQPSKSSRPAPKRGAARKSELAVRSLYFEHDSDEDEEEADTDRIEHPGKNGKAVAKGRPIRGRPRKSSRKTL
ncbi:MAG: hypothetical protein M1827_003911 [Pycnora praestabilis]|nr:MAG: hypothetical protein M1827_003911 [Pycnora praestabilis]